jgi:chaperonin GroEL (HSP60 family)
MGLITNVIVLSAGFKDIEITVLMRFKNLAANDANNQEMGKTETNNYLSAFCVICGKYFCYSR